MSMATVRTVELAEMLGDLEHQAVALVLGLERIENRGQFALELHVDNGADDLRDASRLVGLSWPFYPRYKKSWSRIPWI